MKQIIVYREDAKFVWTEVEENQYEEEFWNKSAGDAHLTLQHTVKYLTREQAESFASQLMAIGFKEMTPQEQFEERKKKMRIRRDIKLNAKALYIVSDLTEVYTYLFAKVDDGNITAQDADKIVEELNVECANILVGKIENIKKMIKELK